MARRKCARCGVSPPDGFASVYQGGVQSWYCHPDDENKDDCYSLSAYKED